MQQDQSETGGMNYPAAELRGIWNTGYSSQKPEFFFEGILFPLLDSEFWIPTPKQSFEEFF
jgi:hypothetical protein